MVEGTGEGSIYWRNPPTEADRGVRGCGSARAALEADRRARAKVRRFCVRNGLDRLGTLTYAPEHLPEDWSGVWDDIERFRKRLGNDLGENIPLVATIERGGKHGRLHVHIAYGQYIDKATMASAWGRGFVDLRKLKVAGKGKRERCRRAAAYISKYVTKAYADGEQRSEGRDFNGRRYSVTKGYREVRRSVAVDNVHDGVRQLQQWCGGSVVWSWSSATDPEWRAPPVQCMHFGDDDVTIWRERNLWAATGEVLHVAPDHGHRT